ncbi:MAG: hypothetical protein IPK12_24765 [Gemmatimonadetes bacterium]|nr:hypothetical protein [Gemmatimonadota bacterium]
MHSRSRKQLARAHAVAGFATRYPALTEPGLGVEAQLTACLAQAAALEAREREAEADGITLAAARATRRRNTSPAASSCCIASCTSWRSRRASPSCGCPASGSAPTPSALHPRRARPAHLAARHEALLIQHNMPVAMLKVLTGHVTEAEDLHRRRLAAAAVSGQVALELGRLLADIALVLRRLDALYRLRFLAAPERLTEWRAALALPRTLDAPAPDPVTSASAAP